MHQVKTEIRPCIASAQVALIPGFPAVSCWFLFQPQVPNVQVEHLCAFDVVKIQKTWEYGIRCAETKNRKKLMSKNVTQLHRFM